MTGWKRTWPATRADPIAQASFAASAATSLSWIRWSFAWTLAATRQLAAAASAASPAPAVRAELAAAADPADRTDAVATAAVIARTRMATIAPASRPAPKQRLITQHLDLTETPAHPWHQTFECSPNATKGASTR